MSGSRKNLNNIEGQLTQIKKGYNKKENSLGAQIAVLDAVAFQEKRNRTINNECQTKARQHQSAKKLRQRNLVRTITRRMPNTESERSF